MRNNEIVRLGLILCVITFSVALLLALANFATEDIIKASNVKAQDEARKLVLPEAEECEEIKIEGVGEGEYKLIKSVYVGKSGSNNIGYSIGVVPNGFGGAIDMIVGINSEGKLTGTNIINHQETPGLGSKAKEPKFSEQYSNKSVESLFNVIKNGAPRENEIVAISGATITSSAVTDGVNSAIKIYKEKLSKR